MISERSNGQQKLDELVLAIDDISWGDREIVLLTNVMIGDVRYEDLSKDDHGRVDRMYIKLVEAQRAEVNSI